MAVFVSPAEAQPEYRVVDLGPLGFTADPDRIGTFDINDHEQVAYGLLTDGAIQPAVWLPKNAYGLTVPPEGGPIELFDAFGITAWTTGIAMDINDDGIVVGQVGGHERNVPGSRAAWWDLNTMTWGTIAPQPPASGPAEEWQDWTRAIAVAEGTDPTILVETWDEAPCRTDCGFQPLGGVNIGIVGTAAVTKPTIVISAILEPDALDCLGGAEGRDVRDVAADVEVVGSNGLEGIRDGCINPGGDPCQPLRIGYRWEIQSTGTFFYPLADFDTVAEKRGSTARGLSDDGVHVGWAFDVRPSPERCFQRSVVWESGGATFATLESPAPSESNQFRAEGVTGPRSAGRLAVGWNTFFDSPVRWRDDGTSDWEYTDLGPLGNVVDLSTCDWEDHEFPSVELLSFATDVSDDDWVVVLGQTDQAPAPFHTYVLVPLTQPECPADIDRDGEVALSDLLIVLGSWGGCSPCDLCPQDIDGDSMIGTSDLLSILAAWGSCTGAAGSIPQTVEDCFEKFGSDPIALEACLQAIGATE